MTAHEDGILVRGAAPWGGTPRMDSWPEPPEWMGGALCAQTDPEAFFPEKGASTKAAKRICGSCPVRDECLEYAIENEVRFGVWGGLSDRERRRVARQRREDAA